MIMCKKENNAKLDYEYALKSQNEIVKSLFQRFLSNENMDAFLVYYREVLKYIDDLCTIDSDRPYVLGASKILVDCALFICELENKRVKILKESTNDFDELKEILKKDKSLMIWRDCKQHLLILAGKFLSKTCRVYYDLLQWKNEDVTPSQATIRYQLSYYSKYAGNMEECLKYRSESEHLILEYSLKNGQNIDQLREKCFIELPQLLKSIQNY